MSQKQLAHAIGVPGNRIQTLINRTRAITGDTDLRLSKFFGLSEALNACDTLEAKRRIAAQLAKIKLWKRARALKTIKASFFAQLYQRNSGKKSAA